MLEILTKLMAVGADLSSRSAIKKALSFIGEDDELVDQIYTFVKNKSYESNVFKVPFEKRALFLPQCLRNSKECQAELTKKGYVCKKCGNCNIFEIIEYAENLGYKHIYIVPGGSLVFKILREINNEIKAAIGVACFVELAEASERLSRKNIPHQCIPLMRAGCIDTVVDVGEVKKIIGRKI
ncbi:DUF116 domain-containing protein [Archaeoglobales archaeon]|nr:MAG: DUF116 domain-containing protein [Archaeoglobales archaeon]